MNFKNKESIDKFQFSPPNYHKKLSEPESADEYYEEEKRIYSDENSHSDIFLTHSTSSAPNYSAMHDAFLKNNFFQSDSHVNSSNLLFDSRENDHSTVLHQHENAFPQSNRFFHLVENYSQGFNSVSPVFIHPDNYPNHVKSHQFAEKPISKSIISANEDADSLNAERKFHNQLLSYNFSGVSNHSPESSKTNFTAYIDSLDPNQFDIEQYLSSQKTVAASSKRNSTPESTWNQKQSFQHFSNAEFQADLGFHNECNNLQHSSQIDNSYCNLPEYKYLHQKHDESLMPQYWQASQHQKTDLLNFSHSISQPTPPSSASLPHSKYIPSSLPQKIAGKSHLLSSRQSRSRAVSRLTGSSQYVPLTPTSLDQSDSSPANLIQNLIPEPKLPLVPPPKQKEPVDLVRRSNEALLALNLEDVTVTELKTLLRQRGLCASGKKSILVERIRREREALERGEQTVTSLSNRNPLHSFGLQNKLQMSGYNYQNFNRPDQFYLTHNVKFKPNQVTEPIIFEIVDRSQQNQVL